MRVEVTSLETRRSVQDVVDSLSDQRERLLQQVGNLAGHVKRLLEEKALLAGMIAERDRKLENYNKVINAGLAREADLQGRLLGVMAMKMENIDLADPRLPIPSALIDFGQHSLRALEKRA